MIDVTQEIDAVHREVGAADGAPGDAKTVRLRRTYAAPIDDVWDALTNPARIGRWFLPISGDFRLGGTYQFEGNAGGRILACDRPNGLKVTWEFGGGSSDLELRLTPSGADATVFELIHSAAVPEEMWEQFGPGAVGVGWEGGLLGLALHFRDGAGFAGDPEAWSTSDIGKDFNRRSAAAWGDASRAAGMDAATVASNVQATTAFYTGEQPGEPPAA